RARARPPAAIPAQMAAGDARRNHRRRHAPTARRACARPGAMNWTLRFLGVGNANAIELGSASAVIECDGQPLLMIDCGQEALTAYHEHYGAMPEAVFITHVHMDHVA